MIESDYLVIGTGPVGVFTLKYLLEKGHTVTIIDNSQKMNPSNDKKELNLKDFDEKSEVYDLNNTAYLNNKKIFPISSKSRGGFTKVWGGTLNSLSNGEIEMLEIPLHKYNETYDEILKVIPNNKHIDGTKEIANLLPSEHFEESILALNPENGLVWSSEELLIKLLNEYSNQVTYLNHIDVINIKDKNSSFEIETTENKIKALVFKIFICTGTLSSAQIASRIIRADYFTIKDSNLTVWPLLRLNKNSGFKKTELLNDKAYTRFIIKFIKNDSLIKFQVFEINNEVIKAIKKRLPIFSKIIIPFIVAIKNRFYLVFAYKNSKNSPTGIFQLSRNKTTKIKTLKPEKNISIFSFFGRFLKYKFLLIPIRYKYRDYGSFHSGNTELYKNDSRIKFNDLGALQISDNIHFIDSTIMKFIPAGPFTISSIIFSRFTLEKILGER